MHPSRDRGARTTRRGAYVAAAALAALAVAPSSPAASPTAAKCPSASVVSAALKQKDKAPVSTVTTFSKTCTYAGSGVVPTKITFQKDTSATFAAGEKAVAALGIVKIAGLGQAAWATKAGGDLEVYRSGETLKILAPLTTNVELEALARKLL